MSTPRFRILAAAAGIVASLFLVAPAHAEGSNVNAVNDGEATCTKTGFIYVPWHIVTNGDKTITNLDSVPSFNNFVVVPGGIADPWDPSTTIAEFVPNGTASPALTFTWTDPVTHETGTGTGTTTQVMPKCDGATVGAKFARECNKLVDVTLTNASKQDLVFRTNGVDHTVAAQSSATIKGVAGDDNGDIVTFVLDDTFGGIPTDMYHLTGKEDCATAGPTNTTTPPAALVLSPAPALPVTGSNLTGIIGAGGGLLAVGALLVALSVLRRRRQAGTSN